MAEPFIAQIIPFAGNFAIRSWAFCDGQLLPISQNTALFSLVGTTYGGDGRTTFALPDLKGRAPVHPGTGGGLPSIRLGEKFGAPSKTLTTMEMPSHNHAFTTSGMTVRQPASSAAADTDTPGTDKVPAKTTAPGERGTVAANSYNASPDTTLAEATVEGTGAIGNTGGNQAFNLYQPSLGINFLIALQGIFPSRS